MKHTIILSAGTERVTGENRLIAIVRATDHGRPTVREAHFIKDLQEAESLPLVVRGLSPDGTFALKVNDYHKIKADPMILHMNWSSNPKSSIPISVYPKALGRDP